MFSIKPGSLSAVNRNDTGMNISCSDSLKSFPCFSFGQLAVDLHNGADTSCIRFMAKLSAVTRVRVFICGRKTCVLDSGSVHCVCTLGDVQGR